jgi:stage V sporulation protein AB
MYVNHIFLGIFGLCAGLAVSAGTFAFLIVIGVVPRMIGVCNRAAEVLHFENAIILGGIMGNLLSVFPQLSAGRLAAWVSGARDIGASASGVSAPGAALWDALGSAFLCAYGISAGIFVGCIAVALAEILNTFPIVFRRLNLKVGLPWVMAFMAFGKTAGALWYFIHRM